MNLFRARLVDLISDLLRESAGHPHEAVWDQVTDEVDIFLFNNLDLVKGLDK